MATDKKRILVVDDETSFTRLVKLNLEQTGEFEVQVENQANSAPAAARRFKPDLVLLDVMMPGVDGGTVAAQLRSDPTLAHVPVVFLTAAVKKEEVLSHGGQIGGMAFLAKPVELDELLACLKKYFPA